MEVRREGCRSEDLTSGWSAVWLWRVPWVLVAAGAVWPQARFWLWIPAFLVAGSGCVANARRCGRLHCYVTGPLYLGAALYLSLALLLPRAVPFAAGGFLGLVLVVSLAAQLAERWLGRYRRPAESQVEATEVERRRPIPIPHSPHTTEGARDEAREDGLA